MPGQWSNRLWQNHGEDITSFLERLAFVYACFDRASTTLPLCRISVTVKVAADGAAAERRTPCVRGRQVPDVRKTVTNPTGLSVVVLIRMYSRSCTSVPCIYFARRVCLNRFTASRYPDVHARCSVHIEISFGRVVRVSEEQLVEYGKVETVMYSIFVYLQKNLASSVV